MEIERSSGRALRWDGERFRLRIQWAVSGCVVWSALQERVVRVGCR
jgi:hypothetical protein